MNLLRRLLLVSVAAADGKVLWSVPWRTDWDVNAAMPVLVPPDKIFISSSYDTGGALYQVKKSGDKYQAVEVWRNRNMKNHFNSSIYDGGYLYGFDDRTLKCIDVVTGEEKWTQSGFSKGSLLLVDGHLIVLSEEGRVEEESTREIVEVVRESLARALPKLDGVAFGLSMGILCGFGLLLATLVLILKGGDVVGPRLQLLSEYFPGYSVTPGGSVLGLAYGFATGLIGGWGFAFLRNGFQFLYMAAKYRSAERLILRKLLDYF